MNITVEKSQNCLAKLQIEVPTESKTAAYNQVLKGYMMRAQFPGFRKGKVPQSVVAKKFHDAIKADVDKQLIETGLKTASSEHNLDILQMTGVTRNDDATYTLQVVLNPEVILPDYHGLTIKVREYAVKPEDVEKTLQDQREAMADLKDVEREVQAGDFLTISYSGTLDGDPFKNHVPASAVFLAENHDYVVKADAESLVPGFCEQLYGAKKGEQRTVKITMPEGTLANLQGKEIVYEVTVHAVKEAVLPALDDAFANRLVEGLTLTQIRDRIQANLEAQFRQKSLEQKRIAAMIALRDKMEFDLPDAVVLNAAQRRANQLVQMNMERGMDRDTIIENEAEIIQAAKNMAKIDVKDEFILIQVAKSEKLTVTEKDVVQRIRMIAAQTGSEPAKVIKSLQKENKMTELEHSIYLAKALDALVARAVIEIDENAVEITGE